jgi:hypothetical protein
LHVTNRTHHQRGGNQHYRKDGAFYAKIPDSHGWEIGNWRIWVDVLACFAGIFSIAN